MGLWVSLHRFTEGGARGTSVIFESFTGASMGI